MLLKWHKLRKLAQINQGIIASRNITLDSTEKIIIGDQNNKQKKKQH